MQLRVPSSIQRFRSSPVTTACRVTLTLLAIYAAYLVTLAVSLSPELFVPLFSEAGPFERMSAPLWLGLAMMLLVTLKTPAEAAMAALALLCAARETDWHKAFTAQSITKISTYLSEAVPWREKLAGAAIIALALGLATYLAVRLYRYLIRQQGITAPAGQVLAVAVVLLPLSKLLDRTPSLLRNSFGIVIRQSGDQIMKALEEGIEMLVPVLLIVVLMLFRGETRLGSLTEASSRQR